MRPRTISLWRQASSALLDQIQVGSLTVVEGSERHAWGSGHPAATIHLHSPEFWRALMRGSRGLAESYRDGIWDSPDLVAVIRLAARNAFVIDRVRSLTAPLWTPRQRVRAALNRSTRQRSRRDIAAHYDLGNDLLRADARPDDDVLLRAVRTRGHDARGGLARQARAGL